jgi:hypothetical protein
MGRCEIPTCTASRKFNNLFFRAVAVPWKPRFRERHRLIKGIEIGSQLQFVLPNWILFDSNSLITADGRVIP